MHTDITLSIIFLVLLGLTIIGGRHSRAGIGETPLIYSSVIIQFILNISFLGFIGLSIYLLFYSWKLFLLLLGIGFVTESLIIVPIIEIVLALIAKAIISKAKKK